MADITGKKVAFVLTDGFEDSELTSPWEAVQSAGGKPTPYARHFEISLVISI